MTTAPLRNMTGVMMALVVENWSGAATIVGIGAGRTDVGERRGGEVGEGDRAAFCQLTSLDTAHVTFHSGQTPSQTHLIRFGGKILL